MTAQLYLNVVCLEDHIIPWHGIDGASIAKTFTKFAFPPAFKVGISTDRTVRTFDSCLPRKTDGTMPVAPPISNISTNPATDIHLGP